MQGLTLVRCSSLCGCLGDSWVVDATVCALEHVFKNPVELPQCTLRPGPNQAFCFYSPQPNRQEFKIDVQREVPNRTPLLPKIVVLERAYGKQKGRTQQVVVIMMMMMTTIC